MKGGLRRINMASSFYRLKHVGAKEALLETHTRETPILKEYREITKMVQGARRQGRLMMVDTI